MTEMAFVEQFSQSLVDNRDPHRTDTEILLLFIGFKNSKCGVFIC